MENEQGIPTSNNLKPLLMLGYWSSGSEWKWQRFKKLLFYPLNYEANGAKIILGNCFVGLILVFLKALPLREGDDWWL